MHGQGPHPALCRHGRVNHLGRVTQVDKTRRFAGHLVTAGKNAEPVAQGLFERHRDQGRTGVDEHEALGRGLALEGHLAVAVAFLRGQGAEMAKDLLRGQRPMGEVFEFMAGSVEQLVDLMRLGQGAYLGVARVGLVEKHGGHLVGDDRGHRQQQNHRRGAEKEEKLADAPGIDRTVDPDHRVDQRWIGIAHAVFSLHLFSRKLAKPVFSYPIARKSSTGSSTTCSNSMKIFICTFSGTPIGKNRSDLSRGLGSPCPVAGKKATARAPGFPHRGARA